MPIIRKCKVCNKEFSTYPSKIKIGRGKYCSKVCCLKKTGIKKGQRLSRETEFKKGEKPSFYKGFRHTQSRPGGRKYTQLHRPNHPDCDSSGYVREHRLVAEQKIGRRLSSDEIVHHIDDDGLNNHPDNLEVMPKREHDKMNINLNIHKRWTKGGGS